MSDRLDFLEAELEFHKKMWEAADVLLKAYRENQKKSSHEVVQTRWDCGCITCICEDEERCHGCGARACATYPDCECGRRDVELDSYGGPLGLVKSSEYNKLTQFIESMLPAHRTRGHIAYRCYSMLADANIGDLTSSLEQRVAKAVEYIERLRKELAQERE